jgi:hypothetical protein
MTMQHSTLADAGAPLGRRQFLQGVGLAVTAMHVGAMPVVGAINIDLPPACALHDGQPYMDASGLARPYTPPKGLRGGDCLRELDEISLRIAHFYL